MVKLTVAVFRSNLCLLDLFLALLDRKKDLSTDGHPGKADGTNLGVMFFIQHSFPKFQKILDVEDQCDTDLILIHHAGVSLFLRMSLNGTLFRGSDYMALLIREVKLPLEIPLFVQFSDD